MITIYPIFKPTHKHVTTDARYERILVPNLRVRDNNGLWHDGVLYRNPNKDLFVRTFESFNESFEELPK